MKIDLTKQELELVIASLKAMNVMAEVTLNRPVKTGGKLVQKLESYLDKNDNV